MLWDFLGVNELQGLRHAATELARHYEQELEEEESVRSKERELGGLRAAKLHEKASQARAELDATKKRLDVEQRFLGRGLEERKSEFAQKLRMWPDGSVSSSNAEEEGKLAQLRTELRNLQRQLLCAMEEKGRFLGNFIRTAGGPYWERILGLSEEVKLSR